MMLFLNKGEPEGQIKAAEFVRLGKRYDVPTFNDAARMSRRWRTCSRTRSWVRSGRLLRRQGHPGAAGAGLLLGRADLIHAARLHTAPHSDTIGRGLKVSKEEMVAMMVAVELYLERDHLAEWREWERRVDVIRESLASVPGVTTERFIPQSRIRCPTRASGGISASRP